MKTREELEHLVQRVLTQNASSEDLEFARQLLGTEEGMAHITQNRSASVGTINANSDQPVIVIAGDHNNLSFVADGQKWRIAPSSRPLWEHWLFANGIGNHNLRVLHQLGSAGKRKDKATGKEETVDLTRVYCQRGEEESLLARLHLTVSQGSLNNWHAVVGESGYGKSALLYEVATELLNGPLRDQVLILQATHLASNDISRDVEVAQVSRRLSIPTIQGVSLAELFNYFENIDRPPILLLDTFDYIVSRIGPESAFHLLLECQSRCAAVFTTCRPLEYRSITQFGERPSEAEVRLYLWTQEQREAAVELYVNAYYQDESKDRQTWQHERIIEMCSIPRIRQIFSNPLLARMTFEVFAPETIDGELDSGRVMAQYWNIKVNSAARSANQTIRELTRLAKLQFTLQLARQLMRHGKVVADLVLLETTKKFVGLEAEILEAARIDLISENVLQEISVTGSLGFFHQSFLEYTAALYISEDTTLGRFFTLLRAIEQDSDLLRAPILVQAVLLFLEKDENAPLLHLLRSNHDLVLEAAFEVLAKSRQSISLLAPQLGKLLQSHKLSRQCFFSTVQFMDPQRLEETGEIVRSLFPTLEVPLKINLFRQLRNMADDFPGEVGSFVTMLPFNLEDFEGKVGTGPHLRQLWRKTAYHHAEGLFAFVVRWLETPKLPIAVRLLLLESLQPASVLLGHKLLKLLLNQWPFLKTGGDRDLAAEIGAEVDPSVWSHVFPEWLQQLNEALDAGIKIDRHIKQQKMLLAVLLAHAPQKVLIDNITNIVAGFENTSDIQIPFWDVLLHAVARRCPAEFWGTLQPQVMSNAKPSHVSLVLSLVSASSTLDPRWENAVLSLQNPTSPGPGPIKIIVALRALKRNHWRVVHQLLREYLQSSGSCAQKDDIIIGITQACHFVTDQPDVARDVSLLLNQIANNTPSEKVWLAIMRAAIFHAHTNSDLSLSLGLRYIDSVKDIDQIGRPCESLLDSLTHASMQHATQLAQRMELIDDESAQRGVSNYYKKLASVDPLKTLDWVDRRPQSPPAGQLPSVTLNAAEAMVVALEASPDPATFERVAYWIPFYATKSTKCAQTMAAACTRLARWNPDLAEKLFLNFVTDLRGGALFIARHTVQSLAVSGGINVARRLRASMAHHNVEVQKLIVQGIAHSPYYEILGNLHDDPNIAGDTIRYFSDLRKKLKLDYSGLQRFLDI